jgi:hypothetical protein
VPVEVTGIEPATCTLRTQGHPDASDASKGLASTLSVACTAACTSEAQNANAGTLDAYQGRQSEGADQGEGTNAGPLAGPADPVASLAAVLLNLSPADRERLAAMLTGHQ